MVRKYANTKKRERYVMVDVFLDWRFCAKVQENNGISLSMRIFGMHVERVPNATYGERTYLVLYSMKGGVNAKILAAGAENCPNNPPSNNPPSNNPPHGLFVENFKVKK